MEDFLLVQVPSRKTSRKLIWKESLNTEKLVFFILRCTKKGECDSRESCLEAGIS